MTAQERRHDLADQLEISDALEAGEEAEVGMLRIEAGQRIDLEEIGLALAVEADVHPPAVAAAQGAPAGERDIRGGDSLGSVHEPQGNLVLPVLLVLVAIAMGDRLGGGSDLHDAKDFGIRAGAGDAGGEFAPREV